MGANAQRTARIAGVWFILTFVFSIPTLWLYSPVLHHHDYILNGSQNTRVAIGALFDLLTGVAGIATAVVLYPILKRQSRSIALGYVATRIVETATIVLGLVVVLALLKLRKDLGGSGGNSASLVDAGWTLVAVHNGAFLLGPSFCAGIGNGILLGFLLYRSGLVPRRLAMIGLVGGPLAFLAATLALLGAYSQNSGLQNVLTAPEIVWEAALGIYLTIKGFRPSPLIAETSAFGDSDRQLPAQHQMPIVVALEGETKPQSLPR